MSLLQWLLPHYCQLCSSSRAAKQGLCLPCYSDLPWIKPNGCPVCALPMLENVDLLGMPCGDCQSQNPAYDTIITPLYYQQPASFLIRSLKFNNQIPMGKRCSDLMVTRLQAHYQNQKFPEILIPIPLHDRRLFSRGFNQSILLAQHLSRTLKVPVNGHAVARIKQTRSQPGLDKTQRRQNVRRAFRILKLPQVRYVALIDDVVTTGATINEVSQLLKNAGIEKVDVWCFARTPYKHE